MIFLSLIATASASSCASRVGCQACIAGVKTSSTGADFACVYYEGRDEAMCVDSATIWTILDNDGYDKLSKTAFTQCPASGMRSVGDYRGVGSVARDPLARLVEILKVVRSDACNYNSCQSCTGVSKVSGNMGECAWLKNRCITPDAFFALKDGSQFSDLKFAESDCGSRAVGFERSMRDARMADFWNVRNVLSKWGRSNACTYDSCTSCTGLPKVSGSMGECAWLKDRCITPDAFFALNDGSQFSDLKFSTGDCPARAVGFMRMMRSLFG